jgi:hypothetical protein
LARAQLIADNYFAEKLVGLQKQELNAKREKKHRRSARFPTDQQQQLVDDLRRKHDASLICDIQASFSHDLFVQFRWKFMELHGSLICEHLRRLFNNFFCIKFAPLSCDVASTFMKACQGGLVGILRPAYHGTNETNLPSIYRQGLLIPGQNNEIRVANGSAHGLGIYTADVIDPHLSWSFARGSSQRLLICGVIDDVGHSSAPEVKHVGSALVVFNRERVAPLFEVTLHKPSPQLPEPKPSFAAALGEVAVQKATQQTRQTQKQRKSHRIHRHRHSASQQLNRVAHVAKFLARRAARRRRHLHVA